MNESEYRNSIPAWPSTPPARPAPDKLADEREILGYLRALYPIFGKLPTAALLDKYVADRPVSRWS